MLEAPGAFEFKYDPAHFELDRVELREHHAAADLVNSFRKNVESCCPHCIVQTCFLCRETARCERIKAERAAKALAESPQRMVETRATPEPTWKEKPEAAAPKTKSAVYLPRQRPINKIPQCEHGGYIIEGFTRCGICQNVGDTTDSFGIFLESLHDKLLGRCLASVDVSQLFRYSGKTSLILWPSHATGSREAHPSTLILVAHLLLDSLHAVLCGFHLLSGQLELLFYTSTSLDRIRGSLLCLFVEDARLFFHLTDLPVEDDGSHNTNDKQKPRQPHHMPIGFTEPPYVPFRPRARIGYRGCRRRGAHRQILSRYIST